MKLQNRTERYMIRMKKAERAYLEREAGERGQRLSDYVRAVLFANAVFVFSDDKNTLK